MDGALQALTRWTREHGVELVRAPAEMRARDLVVALGGDGTVLSAVHAAAGAPVLGVACGSLGALSAVSAGRLADALDRIWAGDWQPRALPALEVSDAGWAVNDLVVVRRGAGQLVVALAVDGEPYARLAGDGLIVATALGSSAYSMAAGGPLLATGTAGYVCTPLAAHGGSAPPLVLPAGAELTVDVEPGHGGFEVELDGRRVVPRGLRFLVGLDAARATLVSFVPPGRGLAALRERGLLADSPRVLARDARAQLRAATSSPPPAA